jgi:hypothetical protein
MTFGHWDIAEEAVDLHEHHYAQEEVWNVVSGEIVLVIDAHEHRLEAGDAAIVPPVSHSARVLGACQAVVVDHPCDLGSRPSTARDASRKSSWPQLLALTRSGCLGPRSP